MAKHCCKYLFSGSVLCGCLALMTGCDIATNQAMPTDLTVFIQQFAREALAAFLF